MVQRKVPSKLGIQADNVKFEKRLANLKTSSQFHDGKHRGADLKKKMKKSRSIKLSDIESLRSSPLRKNISQQGKPPPLTVPNPNTPEVPQKQPLTKTTDGSPNYMKPTSCSDARKDKSQVSLQNSSSARFSDGKNQNRRNLSNSKLSSPSNNKPARTTRTSNLKLVRTLIKSPSFKPARASAKKSSSVALCADVNVQRATCSSTLKDTKSPDYLVINPGGTEAEGTSVMKVCPYTYCSLNGHHHSPVPPLKSFLSARRRSLKTQKMMKLQALSPRGPKQSNHGRKEIDFQPILFDDNDKHADKIAALHNLDTTPTKYDAGMDFFVGIYTASKEDDAEAIGRKSGADERKQDDYKDPLVPNDASDEAETENFANNLVLENLSDSLPQSESDSEAEIYENVCEEAPKEDADEDYSPLSDEEETVTGSCSNESSDSEGLSSIEVGYASSETTDIEWEEGQFSSIVLDEADMYEEPLIKSDAIVGSNNDMVQDYSDILQELLDEKNQSFEKHLNDGCVSEQDGTKQNFDIQEPGQVYERLGFDQHSYTEDALEEGSELSETDSMEITSSSTEEPIEELTATGEEIQGQNGVFQAEDHEMNSQPENDGRNTSMETDEASGNEPKDTFQDDETSILTGDQISIATWDISEIDENAAIGDFGLEQELAAVVAGNQIEETEQQVDDAKSSEQMRLPDSAYATSEGDLDAVKVDDHENGEKTEALQLNDSAEDGNCHDIVDESIFVDTNGNLLDGNHKNNVIAENQIFLENRPSEIKKPKISCSVESENESYLSLNKSGLSGNSKGEPDNMEVENSSETDAIENSIIAINSISPGLKRKFSHAEYSNQELPNSCNYRKGIKSKRLSIDGEEQRKFNPREPNYLPLAPDPEAEKVDLRHQMMDEKKNADEWMLDFALQQAVTKLAPARKKKVALLVEAFETVMPVPKCETRLRRTSAAFSQGRPVQACS